MSNIIDGDTNKAVAIISEHKPLATPIPVKKGFFGIGGGLTTALGDLQEQVAIQAATDEANYDIAKRREEMRGDFEKLTHKMKKNKDKEIRDTLISNGEQLTKDSIRLSEQRERAKKLILESSMSDEIKEKKLRNLERMYDMLDDKFESDYNGFLDNR